MGDMFKGLRDTLLQAKNVFAGVRFTNSEIPLNLFKGCTKLNNISRFFSGEQFTNNGNVFVFPQE
jgi:hypothetical protein